jgi:hypothetical protein
VTFELKLEVGEQACLGTGFGLSREGKPLFTESLILAQDERWRRA